MSRTNDTIILFDENQRQYVLSHHLGLIPTYAELMHGVIYGTETFYGTGTYRFSGRRRVSQLGDHWPRFSEYMNLYRDGYSFHPALRLGFETIKNHRLKNHLGADPSQKIADSEATVADVFDDWLATARATVKDQRIKKKVSDWESKIKKNLSRIDDIEREIFRRHSEVLVVRLDLYHHAAKFLAADIFKIAEEQEGRLQDEFEKYFLDKEEPLADYAEARVSFETVQTDRQKFFTNIKGKPSLFKHLIAYVWRIEFTPGAGYHMHLCLIFNGARVQHHEWLAQQIGEYWSSSITGGRGYYHNCNAAWKADAPTYGLGKISYLDIKKRENFRKYVLGYLAKEGQLVQVLPFEGCHLFGSGFIHRDSSKGRGRPRSEQSPGVPPARTFC